MSLLPLWNNTFALTLILMTGVLALACVGASRFRLSATAKNSILLPALVVASALPIALLAARSVEWSIPVPILRSETAHAHFATHAPSSRALPGTPTPPSRQTSGASTTPDQERAGPTGTLSRLNAAHIVTTGLLGVWILGAALCFVRLGRSYHSLWRLLANAHPVEDPRVARAAEKARATLGLPKFPTILATDGVSSPVAVGTPRYGWVIFPPNTLDQMPQDQLEHVLLHEGAHIAHRDTSLKLAQGFIAALWWWHPLVHLLNRQLSRTREELCDNAVLSSTDAADYGQTLLEFEKPMSTPRSPALAVTLFPEHERLEPRIRSLLNPRRNTMHQSRPLVLMTACLAGLAASALAGVTQVTANPTAVRTPSALWTEFDDRTLVREYMLEFEDDERHRHLDIDIKRGDIRVTAYDGEQVLVRLSVPTERPAATTRDGGFRSISGEPLDFQVRQHENTIELDANDYEQTTHVEVLVPRRIDLTLDSYRAGLIRVAGTEGHIRARSQDNDISLTDISGTADVYGYNGNFTLAFREVTGDLEFETYNGNINLLLPADIQTTTYLRVENQQVQSQFPIAPRPALLNETRRADGTRALDFGDYVIGDINGGGARTVIETTNGSVVLRTY